MNAIAQTFRTLMGLFFDDGSLALAIVTLLVAVTLLAKTGLLESPLMMALLVIGTLVLLLENVMRTARRQSRCV
jgi:hypothetical protein